MVATPSKYISNFWSRSPYLHEHHLTCELSARWFALVAAVDRRLPEQRRKMGSEEELEIDWNPGGAGST